MIWSSQTLCSPHECFYTIPIWSAWSFCLDSWLKTNSVWWQRWIVFFTLPFDNHFHSLSNCRTGWYGCSHVLCKITRSKIVLLLLSKKTALLPISCRWTTCGRIKRIDKSKQARVVSVSAPYSNKIVRERNRLRNSSMPAYFNLVCRLLNTSGLWIHIDQILALETFQGLLHCTLSFCFLWHSETIYVLRKAYQQLRPIRFHQFLTY